MKYPDSVLILMLDRPVTLVIDGHRLEGVLTGYDRSDFVIQTDDGELVVNRRCVDMIFLTPQETA